MDVLRNAALAAAHGLSACREAYERRLARRIDDPARLPALHGSEEEKARGEAVRQGVLALMALRRKTPAQEAAMLELLRVRTDAAWWTDMRCACGTALGVYRLLDRQTARRIREETFAPETRKALPAPGVRYFVDGENVSPNHACVREILQKPDAHIVLFVSDHCQWPKKDDAKAEMLFADANVEFVDCGTGAKNAMDFQIVGVVGEYLAKHPDGAAYIVSNDSGYDAAVNMWLSQGLSVGRIGSASPTESRAVPGGVSRDRAELVRLAEASLHWTGYEPGEKARLADILASFALGEYEAPYNYDIHAAIGHYMACGKRYTTIYAAERGNIAAFLACAQRAV